MSSAFQRQLVLVLTSSLMAGESWAQTPKPRGGAQGAPPPATTSRPVIAHDAVGCVVAERHPELQACFTPAESVARAQVQFRADEKGPWYYVDMKGDGPCRSAVLPKPRRDVGRFHYFIEIIDRTFTSHQSPEAAPEESFLPRVVTSAAACGPGIAVAANSPTASVVMGVSRDAAGNVIQAAVAPGGQVPASISGFSTDGVSMANPAGPGSGTQSEGASKSAKGGGSKTLLIAGGAVAAAGVVALAAGGGGESSSGSGGSGGSGTVGTSGGTGSQAGVLTGRWVGTVDRGDGLLALVTGEGLTCNFGNDLTFDLIQTGTTLTGTGTSVGRSADCGVPLPPNIAQLIAGQGSGALNGTASNGTLTFVAGLFTFNGTYTSTRLEAAATAPIEGINFSLRVRLNKQ